METKFAKEIESQITAERAYWSGLVDRLSQAARLRATGRVVAVTGLTVIAAGPAARVGELCYLHGPDGREPVAAQVIGFREGQTLLLPLGRMIGIAAGWRVVATGRPVSIPVSEGLLGRIVNAFGQPVDGKGPIERQTWRAIENAPPAPLARRQITRPIYFGIRAIDALLTCGLGQRIGVFSGAGVGKSTLLGMMARFHTAEVAVIGLIGERGREVRDFLEFHLGPGLERAVVVVATSDEPALVRITAGLTATTIAEYFRDQGKNVLLLLDSLTRLARAQREVGLAAGETPTTRGYPPSMYEFLAGLLERAGTAARGSITGIYAVLVEGDDIHEPVSDAVSAILDGHIYLTRALADRGHYPAIEVGRSVSRLMPQLVEEEQWHAAMQFRELLAAYREVEDLIAVGAYRPGMRPAADVAVEFYRPMMEFLRQRPEERVEPQEACERLLALMRRAGSRIRA